MKLYEIAQRMARVKMRALYQSRRFLDAGRAWGEVTSKTISGQNLRMLTLIHETLGCEGRIPHAFPQIFDTGSMKS